MSIETLHNKFKSGNSIPVKRSTISRAEYESVVSEFEELEADCSLINTDADLLSSHLDELVEDNGRLEHERDQLKAQVAELKEFIELFRPHIEGVCAVISDRLRRQTTEPSQQELGK